VRKRQYARSGSGSCSFRRLTGSPHRRPDRARGVPASRCHKADPGLARVLVQDLDIRIVNAATGDPLRELVLDPITRYQPTGRPFGSTPKTINP
jgi:hypothetical protein